MRFGITTVFACGLGLMATGAVAADIERGKELYVICAACHGDDGRGVKELDAPSFVGLEGWYLERQVRNFLAGVRGADPRDVYGAQARTMIQTLPDDQAVEDVVAYITTLDGPRPEPTVEGDPELGARAYQVCAACHGANGEGNKALNSPRLAGQSDWYLVRQLKLYREGIRGTHPDDVHGAQMRPMAMTLPDEAAIRNVVAYINTFD